jgi:hypothetical protein
VLFYGARRHLLLVVCHRGQPGFPWTYNDTDGDAYKWLLCGQLDYSQCNPSVLYPIVCLESFPAGERVDTCIGDAGEQSVGQLENGNGIWIRYGQGADCGVEFVRIATNISLLCDLNEPNAAVVSVEQVSATAGCDYTIVMKSVHGCPVGSSAPAPSPSPGASNQCCVYHLSNSTVVETLCTTDSSCPKFSGISYVGSFGVDSCDNCVVHSDLSKGHVQEEEE